MGRVKTLQVGNKLIILDGKGPIRLLNLKTNKVHIYKNKEK
jgi:hypothetical protein